MNKVMGFGIIALSLFALATKSEAASCATSTGNGKVFINVSIINSSKAKYPLSEIVSAVSISGVEMFGTGFNSDIMPETKDLINNVIDFNLVNYTMPVMLDYNLSSVSDYRIDKPAGCSILSENEDITYNVDAVYTGALKSTGRRTQSTPAPVTEVLGADETTVASTTEPVVEPVLTVTPVAVVETPAPVLVTEVLGEEVFRFNTDLRFGMQNDDVSELQKRLQKEGFFKFDKITGFFGPITKQAVKDYQKAKGVAYITGFCGPLTRAELNK